MQSSTNTNRPSFFDDDDISVGFEFQKAGKAHQKDLNYPPTIKGNLIKQLPYSSSQQPGYYVLYNRTLACYKSSTSKAIESVLELAHCKLKAIESSLENPMAGFAITKNEVTYEFYSPDKESIEEWFAILKTICVLTCFHEEYKALKMIGKGSFAKVYLVESKSTGKMFAVKAFTKESVIASNKANAKPSMLNEIDIMRALDHENIIKLYEVHESEKSIYLVLELIQGKSLQDVLKKPTFKDEFSEIKITNMIRSILDALAYLASKGIMHRDLKPDNILLDKDCKIKIADFGLATYINVPEYIFKKCGTPGYIAPEVFKYDQNNSATNYDHKCDTFSAGCIFFFMLFGYPFFESNRASEILRLNRKITAEFDALHTIKYELRSAHSKISKDALNLLLQLLELDQKKRISCSQALNSPYFIPVPIGMQKVTGSNDLVQERTPKGNNSIPKIAIPVSPKNNNQVSPDQAYGFPKTNSLKSPSQLKDRFHEKDSLYLDMGKPELNGRMDTVNTASSNNNSVLIHKKDSNNSIGSGEHSSTFAKNSQRSKSFRVHNGMVAGNQSFLKAALLRNMQKNNSDMPGEETKDDGQSPHNGDGRSLSERGNIEKIPLGNSSDSQDNDTEEDDDVSPQKGEAKGTPKAGMTPKRRFQPFSQKKSPINAK